MKKTKYTDVYEKNLAVFREEYNKEAEIFEKRKYKKKNITVKTVPALSGGTVLSVTEEEGRTLLLGGIYEPLTPIKEQIELWGKVANKTPFLMIGMGHIESIRCCLEAGGEESIFVIYEPSAEIFEAVMEADTLKEVIQDKRVILLVDQLNSGDLKNVLDSMVKFDTVTLLKIIVSPNYEELCPEKVKEALKLVSAAYDNVMVAWNTARLFTNVVGENVCYNMRHMLHGYNVSQLKGMLAGEVPAFIISAGPSLNKNIEELRQAKGRACLIAVDTAIKPLLNRGIIPDFFVIVDGLKPTELMEHPRISEVPIVTCDVVAKGIMDLHQGKKFYYASGSELDEEIYKAVRKGGGKISHLYAQPLATGGSVANTAFSLANYMEASEIIFVGQDLALTNNRTHADGTFQDKMKALSEEERRDVVEVEGIRGNKVYTMLDFQRYLRWFEEYIKANKMKNVIDATQGGAKIHGTKEMTLKRAIGKVCTGSADIGKKLEALPEMMDWGAKQAFLQCYKGFPDEMHKVVQEGEKGERLYIQLGKLVSKDKYDQEKYRKLIKKIGKVNDYMNSSNYGLFVQSTLMHLNFTLRMSIYEETADEREDILAIAKQGRIMNYYIKEAGKEWEDLWEKLLVERPVSVSVKDVQGPLDRLLLEMGGKSDE